MKWSFEARWNRLVSDVRCWIGGALIRAGSKITDAVMISSLHNFEWRRTTRPNDQHNRPASAGPG